MAQTRAEGLLGVIQYTTGALVAPLVGIGGPHTAVPMALVISCVTGLAAVSFVLLARQARPQPLRAPYQG